jgi:hypothetical protein
VDVLVGGAQHGVAGVAQRPVAPGVDEPRVRPAVRRPVELDDECALGPAEDPLEPLEAHVHERLR